MGSYSMAASHAVGKGGQPDVVFAALNEADKATALYGDKVVNATVGAIYDEKGNFATLSTVDEYYRKMPTEELMNYGSIAGLPDFLEAAIDTTFKNYRPENTYIKAVATPGGSGAIRNAIYNYLDIGQKALIPDWFWGPYRTIAEEHLRGVDTYQMFNDNNEFTLDFVKEKSTQLLKNQDNLVVIFNTPGHNPTGYSMNTAEWEDILGFYRDCAQDKKKKIVIVLDIAYIDYAGTVEQTRGYMKIFTDLPENILVTFAFSMSKSFMMYGMRSGALIGLSSFKEIADEFENINTYSGRGVWSNCPRGPQRLLGDVNKLPELKAKIDAEREGYYQMVVKRADIFLKEAKQAGLKTLPFHGGFFITVPAPNPQDAADKLVAENIFVVPLKKGVRFAVCSVPSHKIPGVAAKILRAI